MQMILDCAVINLTNLLLNILDISAASISYAKLMILNWAVITTLFPNILDIPAATSYVKDPGLGSKFSSLCGIVWKGHHKMIKFAYNISQSRKFIGLGKCNDSAVENNQIINDSDYQFLEHVVQIITIFSIVSECFHVSIEKYVRHILSPGNKTSSTEIMKIIGPK